MKKLSFGLLLILFCSFFTLFGQNEADKICGIYLVKEKTEVSKVRISKEADGLYKGEIIWMEEPNFPDGKPKTDIQNPNPALRSTPANEIVLLHNFRYDSKEKRWNGEIYNPTEGKTYKSIAKFENDKKLKIRGYVGVPMLGRTLYWEKLE